MEEEEKRKKRRGRREEEEKKRKRKWRKKRGGRGEEGEGEEKHAFAICLRVCVPRGCQSKHSTLGVCPPKTLSIQWRRVPRCSVACCDPMYDLELRWSSRGCGQKDSIVYSTLVAPYRAILRYYRCDTPYRAILSRLPQQSPNRVRYPPLGAFFYTDISVRYPILQHIARYLCDTPGKQARKSFAILSLKVSRDMKSIAAGPLSTAQLGEHSLAVLIICLLAPSPNTPSSRQV